MKVVIALLVLCAVAVQAAPNVAGKWEATYPYTRSGGQKEFEHVDVPFYLCPNEDGSLWYQSYGQVYGQLSGYSILTPEANTDDSVVTLSGMYYEADFQSPSISYPALRSGYQVLNFTYEYVYRVGMPATRNLVLNGVQYSFGSKSAKGSNSAFTAVPVASLDFETYCMVPAATVADKSPAGRWIGGNGLIGISDANDFCFFEGKKPYFQGSTQNSGGFYFAGVTMSDTNTVGGQWFQRNPENKKDNLWGDFVFRATDEDTLSGWMTVGSSYTASEEQTYWTTFTRHPVDTASYNAECISELSQKWNIPAQEISQSNLFDKAFTEQQTP